MIPKPGKVLNEKNSYWHIPLLPTINKFLMFFIKHPKLIIREIKLITHHQFGFINKGSTVDIHQITHVIE